MIEQRIVNGSQTELYINGEGNFLTQAGTVRRHVFTKRVLLADPAAAALTADEAAAWQALVDAAAQKNITFTTPTT